MVFDTPTPSGRGDSARSARVLPRAGALGDAGGRESAHATVAILARLAAHPAVRFVRRWGWLGWLPAVAVWLGATRAERGLWVLAAVVAVQATWVTALLWLSHRASDRAVSELLQDLAFPPQLRKLALLEARVLAAPLALALRTAGSRRARSHVQRRTASGGARVAGLVRSSEGEAGCASGPVLEFATGAAGFELALALALVPALLVEAVVVHLVVGAGSAIGWALTAVGVYALWWFVGVACSLRAFPHMVGPWGVRLRLGALYRIDVPPDAIAAVRIEPTGHGFGPFLRLRETPRGTRADLCAGGRSDVVLELARPLPLERPLRRPIAVTAVAVPVADARAFAAAVHELVAQGGAGRSAPGREEKLEVTCPCTSAQRT